MSKRKLKHVSWPAAQRLERQVTAAQLRRATLDGLSEEITRDMVQIRSSGREKMERGYEQGSSSQQDILLKEAITERKGRSGKYVHRICHHGCLSWDAYSFTAC